MDEDTITAAATAADPPRPSPVADPVPTTGAGLPPIAEPPQQIDAVIERWWQDHFPGSAVARDTRAWNVAHAAKEELKARLKALFPSAKE